MANSDSEPDPYEAVRALVDANRYDLAMRRLAACIADDPTEFMAYLYMSQCLLSTDRPAEALDAADECLSLGGPPAAAQRLRALALHNLRKDGEADLAAEQSIAEAPWDPNAWVVKSYTALALRRKKEARDAASAAIEISPTYAEAHNSMGLVMLRTWRPWRATKHFKRALEIEPNNSLYRNNLGAAHIASRRYGAAQKHFVASAQADPNAQIARDNIVRNFLSYLGISLFVYFQMSRNFPSTFTIFVLPVVMVAYGVFTFRTVRPSVMWQLLTTFLRPRLGKVMLFVAGFAGLIATWSALVWLTNHYGKADVLGVSIITWAIPALVLSTLFWVAFLFRAQTGSWRPKRKSKRG